MPPSTQPALPDDDSPKSFSSSKPQSAATYTQSRNRVDLILGASHKSILSSLRAGHASLYSSSTTTPPQPPASPASSKPASVGFSALLGGSSSSSSAAHSHSHSNTPRSAATALQDELEREIASLRNTSANAGLGFAAANKQAEKDGPASAAQNAALRRRMGLGRGGRAGDATNGAARRRAREDSSSDEEEGRSALGRRKFKRARAHREPDEMEDHSTADTDAQKTVGPNGEAAPASVNELDAPEGMQAEAGSGIDTPEAQQAAGLPPDGQAQKRKKKKKKKQKMA
ncbi:uncharacterized protein E0L32_008804 [Thyridium curvatum]|uniref:Uncharacterized protein n=1 Tax=Thyridium curvatum TaxID=1093900 RepID=A0A507AR83_9PEZI|nr:uncharacterized protein E0L32_008804 [Thyridium curvatum]TPX09957.1 hypothetical protein E0L32_008804 [Thyridium curvatum]